MQIETPGIHAALATSGLKYADCPMRPITASSSIGANPNEFIVSLSGIPNASRVSVQVSGVNGAHTSSVAMGFLVADVNASRAVGPDDLQQTRARSGQPVTQGNFQFDLNLSGNISASDVAVIKARNGQTLP